MDALPCDGGPMCVRHGTANSGLKAIVSDPGVYNGLQGPNQLFRLHLPSALQKETQPYEVFENIILVR
jgi:hypothetical protein